MTTEEWVEANLAAAPPFTPDQLAALRPIWRPVLRSVTDSKKAAPALTEAAPERIPATR